MRRLILILALLIVSLPASAALKRCIDDDGRTHYYNTILPPECEDKATTEMNKQGVVINRTEIKPVQPPEYDKAAQMAAEQKFQEAARRDAVLLNTYTSEEEIDLARERNVHPVVLTLVGVEKRLEISQTRLDSLRKQANEAEQASSPMLAGIQKDIIPAQREVNNLRNELEENQQRMETIKARFEADKKRFMELKQLSR